MLLYGRACFSYWTENQYAYISCGISLRVQGNAGIVHQFVPEIFFSIFVINYSITIAPLDAV